MNSELKRKPKTLEQQVEDGRSFDWFVQIVIGIAALLVLLDLFL